MTRQIFLLFVIGLLFSIGTSAQKYTFQRYDNKNPVRLKSNSEITIYLNQTTDPLTKDTINNSVYGTLISLDDNFLQLNVNMEYKNIHYGKDSIRENYSKYSYQNPVKYNSASVNYITYTPKARPVIEYATFVSVVTLVAIAPIFSMNIKERTFNGDAYLMIAAPAAVATIITLPFYFNIEERKITIAKQ